MKIEICIVVILSCYIALVTAKCPFQPIIDPCKCETNGKNESSINCGGNTTYNLRVIFTYLSSWKNDDEKHFRLYHFNNTAISELGMNVFYDITFEEIEIHSAYNLSKIDLHAFMPTITHLKRFTISDTPFGGNTSDLFSVINTLINVEFIRISNTSLTVIPSNAFTLLQKLYEVYFTHNSQLKSLGKNAFYELNNLTWLTFSNNSFEYIPDHAFNFRYRLDETMIIDIDNMSNLTTKTFSNATFANVNRRYELRLMYVPQLKYLDETIFDTVLMLNGNAIVMTGWQMECDCRMYWLYANPDVYKNLVLGSKCYDGNSVFTDRQNYTDCSNA